MNTAKRNENEENNENMLPRNTSQHLVRGVSYGPMRGVTYDDKTEQTYAQKNVVPGQCVTPDWGAMSFQVSNIFDGVLQNEAQRRREMPRYFEPTNFEPANTVMRKSRRSRWDQIVVTPDGAILAARMYDDGTADYTPFLLNVRGPWAACSMVVKDVEADDYFAIVFRSGHCILGEKEKLNGKRLYEALVKAGVKFAAGFSQTEINRLLFERFAKQISNPSRQWQIWRLAGWENGKFQAAENFPLHWAREIQHFPVMQRHLAVVRTEAISWGGYFCEMRKIRRWRDRVLIMVFQVSGPLYTLLEQEECEICNALNLVLVKEFPRKKICSWFQIFNRSRLIPKSSGVPEKDWNRNLSECKDENVVLDVAMPEGTQAYDCKKTADRQKKAFAVAVEGYAIPGGSKFRAALITISKEIGLQKAVYNVIVDEDFYREEEQRNDEDSITQFISVFISYCEANLSEIKRIIRSQRNRVQITNLQIVWCILESFWSGEGIDLYQAADIPKRPDFAQLLSEQKLDTGEICQYFRQAIRKAASSCFFVAKEEDLPFEEEIRYAEEFLWFAPHVLDKILKSAGLYGFKAELLFELKKKQILVTDMEGLKRKLQIHGQRKERYQLRRSFFNEVGKLDIVACGKEWRTNV